MAVLLLNNLLNKDFTYLFSGFYQDEIDIISMDGVAGELPADPEKFDSIILSGSEESILKDAYWIDRQMEFTKKVAELGIPLLGVCFGHQLIARALFGKKAVRKCPEHEIGWLRVSITEEVKNDPLFKNITTDFHPFHSHFDEVPHVSRDMQVLACSEKCRVQAMRIKGTNIYGVQFHPEIGTEVGMKHLLEIEEMFPHLSDDIRRALRDPRDSGISHRLFGNFYTI